MRSRDGGRFAVLLALMLGLLVAGCGGGSGGEEAEESAATAQPTRAAGEKIGGSVEVIGNISGEEEKLLNQAIKEFEDDSGVDVKYTATNDFPTLIRSRVAGNNPPDIGLFPQPGLALDLAKQGALAPLDTVIDLDATKESLIPGFLEAATLEGKVYATPMRMAVKSLLWYPVPEFEKAGYQVPETQAELNELADQIKADGKAPWCVGYESGAATGWVGTDWIEEYVLRTGGPEVYDRWVSHELPFNSPEIKQAFEAYEQTVLADDRVLGGRKSIVSTQYGEADNPLFEDPPECMLHRQGNFITGFFPKDVQKNLSKNVGVAYFPASEDGYEGKPLLGGGDVAGIFKKGQDNRAAVELMRFMASEDFGGPWAKAGGWLSPHTTFDESQYVDDTTRQIAQLAAEADVFRFDASDLMPAAVGAGSFWRGMVQWTSGQQELDRVLTDIDESWRE